MGKCTLGSPLFPLVFPLIFPLITLYPFFLHFLPFNYPFVTLPGFYGKIYPQTTVKTGKLFIGIVDDDGDGLHSNKLMIPRSPFLLHVLDLFGQDLGFYLEVAKSSY